MQMDANFDSNMVDFAGGKNKRLNPHKLFERVLKKKFMLKNF